MVSHRCKGQLLCWRASLGLSKACRIASVTSTPRKTSREGRALCARKAPRKQHRTSSWNDPLPSSEPEQKSRNFLATQQEIFKSSASAAEDFLSLSSSHSRFLAGSADLPGNGFFVPCPVFLKSKKSRFENQREKIRARSLQARRHLKARASSLCQISPARCEKEPFSFSGKRREAEHSLVWVRSPLLSCLPQGSQERLLEGLDIPPAELLFARVSELAMGHGALLAFLQKGGGNVRLLGFEGVGWVRLVPFLAEQSPIEPDIRS